MVWKPTDTDLTLSCSRVPTDLLWHKHYPCNKKPPNKSPLQLSTRWGGGGGGHPGGLKQINQCKCEAITDRHISEQGHWFNSLHHIHPTHSLTHCITFTLSHQLSQLPQADQSQVSAAPALGWKRHDTSGCFRNEADTKSPGLPTADTCNQPD